MKKTGFAIMMDMPLMAAFLLGSFFIFIFILTSSGDLALLNGMDLSHVGPLLSFQCLWFIIKSTVKVLLMTLFPISLLIMYIVIQKNHDEGW